MRDLNVMNDAAIIRRHSIAVGVDQFLGRPRKVLSPAPKLAIHPMAKKMSDVYQFVPSL